MSNNNNGSSGSGGSSGNGTPSPQAPELYQCLENPQLMGCTTVLQNYNNPAINNTYANLIGEDLNALNAYIQNDKESSKNFEMSAQGILTNVDTGQSYQNAVANEVNNINNGLNDVVVGNLVKDAELIGDGILSGDALTKYQSTVK